MLQRAGTSEAFSIVSSSAQLKHEAPLEGLCSVANLTFPPWAGLGKGEHATPCTDEGFSRRWAQGIIKGETAEKTRITLLVHLGFISTFSLEASRCHRLCLYVIQGCQGSSEEQVTSRTTKIAPKGL